MKNLGRSYAELTINWWRHYRYRCRTGAWSCVWNVSRPRY